MNKVDVCSRFGIASQSAGHDHYRHIY
jgi:hypothetical protein